MRRAAWSACAAVCIATLAAGCGESKTPGVDAATERAQAQKRAAEGPFGTQMKALETAKGLGAEVNSKVEANVEKVDKESK